MKAAWVPRVNVPTAVSPAESASPEAPQRITRVRRDHNSWVGSETREDYALRYTPQRYRKWSEWRVANTAFGAASFQILEAVGATLLVQYGFINAFWAILATGLMLVPFVAVWWLDPGVFADAVHYGGQSGASAAFQWLLFGAALTVGIALITQMGEQANYLRFMLAKEAGKPLRWWAGVLAGGPGWVVLGRNGVGKTTLLKSLMGLVPIKSGSITLGGVAIDKATPFERARMGVGLVPQGREIFGRLTVQENLLMGLAYKKGSTPIPAELFELFPVLKQMLGRWGGDLSGGQQQQLAI